MWNRFVNTHGGLGRNIPCDLHNEHVNKLLKKIVTNMGSNVTEKALHQSARCVSTLEQLTKTFEEQSDVPVQTSAHHTRSVKTDVHKVTSVVLENQLLQIKPGRQHSKFCNISSNPVVKLNIAKMHAWIKQKQERTAKFMRFTEENENVATDEDTDSTSDED